MENDDNDSSANPASQPSGVSDALSGVTLPRRRGRPRKPENKWLSDIFNAEQARRSGIIRRNVSLVKRKASEEALRNEVIKRGFHLIRSGDQYIVMCHKGELSVIS